MNSDGTALPPKGDATDEVLRRGFALRSPGYRDAMTNADPDRESDSSAIKDHEDLDPETIVEDIGDLFAPDNTEVPARRVPTHHLLPNKASRGA